MKFKRSRQGLIPTLIFGVFFLGFIGFFMMQVQRMVFSDSRSSPDPVAGTATVILRERGNATKIIRSNGTSTPRDVTTYILTGEYIDGDLTRRGKYTVAEDVYFDHEEGSTINIYYYPGTNMSGYGAPPARRSSSNSSFKNMQQLIGVFMMFVAGGMALTFIRKMLMPAFFGGITRTRPLPPTRFRTPTAEDLEDRFGPIPNKTANPPDKDGDDWQNR
jgi:hypothetical protein